MGIQPVRDVDLIRHAYVLPASQGRGVGGALIEHLHAVGDAARAGRHLGRRRVGDPLLPPPRLRSRSAPSAPPRCCKTYWSIPDRQIETSVVLANPPLE